MKNNDKPLEQKSGSATDNKVQSNRENRDHPHKKETMEERARREHWTDVVESHLGIDE